MQFDKYEKYGAYHWADYNRESIYKKHADYVKDWVKGNRILDIGAGDGLITSLLKAEGIDDNKKSVELAKEKKANVKLGSAYNLNGKYDSVFLGDTLEHLEFPEKCLKEIKKVSGHLYISIPSGKQKCKYDYNAWNAKELTELVENVGFKKVGKARIANQRLYVEYKVLQDV